VARKTKKATRNRASRKSKTQAQAQGAKAVEIVFSYGEVDFLRKITKREFEPSSTKERAARLSLRDKLLDIDFSRPTAGGGGLIVLKVDQPEVALLQHVTKEVYSFITGEERRARLILREKILIAAEKVGSGKKTRREKSS
jgi:hypothetical protein